MRAIPNIAPDASVLERLQQQASKNPSGYRRRLAILAVVGDVGLTIVRVLPMAAPILLSALIFYHPLFVSLAVVVTLFLAWLTRPSTRIGGRELSATEAPELYRQVAELQEKLRVTHRMRVVLDDSLNAGALEARGAAGLFGARFVLILGVPLLAILDSRQVLAIVAHELGQFSRRHGRLGHWLYRARVGWLVFAQQVDESDSALDRFGAWYAGCFVPFFSVRSFVHSRQCEYEADKDAASAAGGKTFAQALTRLAVMSRLWDEGLPRQLRAWQRDMAEPPADFHERFERLARDWPRDELDAWLQKALEEQVNWSDTHPTLAERLASMSEPADLVAAGASAGSELLGERWPGNRKEFDAKWSQAARPDWTFAHLRFKHIAGPLLEGDPADAPGEDQLARARALRLFEPAAGLAALKSLYEQSPSDPHVRFAYGAALLADNDESGAEILKALAKDDITLLHPIYVRLLAYFGRAGNDKEVERWSTFCERAAMREAAAVSAFFSEAEAGKARLSTLAPAVKAVIAEAIRLDPCVASGWLLEGDCEIHVPNRGTAVARIRALVLAIDPTRLETGQYTDTVEAHYAGALASLIAPEDIPAVRAFFTTDHSVVYRPDAKYSLDVAAR